MRRILVFATLVTSPACDVIQCGNSTPETTWSWEGSTPEAKAIATTEVTTAVVSDRGLTLLVDGYTSLGHALDIDAQAIAMAPDGSGLIVGTRLDAQLFDPNGVPGPAFSIDPIASGDATVVHDASGYTVLWSVNQQVFRAHISPTGTVTPRTLIGVASPECPKAGPIAAVALEDGHTSWVVWAGAASLVGVRIVDGAIADLAPLELVGDLAPCSAGSVEIAASGTDAMILASRKSQQILVPLPADGKPGAEIQLTATKTSITGTPHGFALIDPYRVDAFPRELYARMRILDRGGAEIVEENVRGASSRFAHSGSRWVAAGGVDLAAGDDGVSSLGVTQFSDDGQSLAVVLDQSTYTYESETYCKSSDY